jgi:SAM-dependent methyltransferase
MSDPSLGTNQSVLRHAAYDADDDLRVRREFHELYTEPKVNFHEWVASQLPLRPDDTLLDVGTGPGDFPQLLRRRGQRGVIVGMDLSQGMAQTAYQAAPDMAWLVGDVQALPFADAQFDGVMARHMLYHVPDIDLAVREMARVMKPEGWCLAITNSRENMKIIFDIWDAVEHTAVGTVEPSTGRFALEQAADWFTPHFAQVETIIQDGAVVLPAIEPLIAYLYSGRHLRMAPDHTKAQWREVQTQLVATAEKVWAERAEGGNLRVSKQMGLVIARH